MRRGVQVYIRNFLVFWSSGFLSTGVQKTGSSGVHFEVLGLHSINPKGFNLLAKNTEESGWAGKKTTTVKRLGMEEKVHAVKSSCAKIHLQRR
jgi:hypothetical protein